MLTYNLEFLSRAKSAGLGATGEIAMLILLIEDDVEIARLTEIYLQSEGYETAVVADGANALEQIRLTQPDLILLDLMLPNVDGFDICKQARKFFAGPILVLTAREDDISEVSLLKLGADDYLRKPAKPHVMSARIEALLRRSKGTHRATENTSLVNASSTHALENKSPAIVIQRETLTVLLNGQPIDLSNAEFDLLALLCERAGDIVSRSECIQILRGISYDISDRSIDMRISGLRKKLNDEKPPYKRIKTIRNKGYLLVNE